MSRGPAIDLDLLRKLMAEGLTNIQIAQRMNCHVNSIGNIRRYKFGVKVGKGHKVGAQPRAQPAPPQSAEHRPLSPAMRHLAKFDAVIANRLRRERGQPELP